MGGQCESEKEVMAHMMQQKEGGMILRGMNTSVV